MSGGTGNACGDKGAALKVGGTGERGPVTHPEVQKTYDKGQRVGTQKRGDGLLDRHDRCQKSQFLMRNERGGKKPKNANLDVSSTID